MTGLDHPTELVDPREYSYALASISSVRASTKYAPPNGSIVFVTPVSSAMICWVRSAIRAAFSVGRAIASS